MSKFIAIAVVAVVIGFGSQATAQAANQGSPCHPVTASPAPLPAQARAYRSYSYEPSAPVIRSYRSYGSYRSYSGKPTYLQGGSKALGRY